MGFWAAAFEKLKQSPLFVKETEGKYAGCWVLKQPPAAAEQTVLSKPLEPLEATAPNVSAPERERGLATADGEGARGACKERQEGEPDGGGEDSEYNPDKVLVRSNGVLTYTAKDIAYHLWKFGLLGQDFLYRPFEDGIWTTAEQGEPGSFGRAKRVLNVIDKRQEYPQAMVRLALQALGFAEEASQLHHVSYGVVSLSPATAARLGIDISEGKSSYPMSGRQGIGIKVSDLLAQMEATVEAVRPRKEGISSRQVAAAAIRYFLLRFNLLTEIVFDFDQAADLHGNSGVYLMYQHARAAKILRDGGWAAAAALTPTALASPLSGDGTSALPTPQVPSDLLPEERALLRHLADWPDTLEQAAAELNVTLLTTYAFELASLFSTFYDAAPVLKAPEPLRTFRMWVVARTRLTLADVLNVLGLPAPDQM
ncbi:MAG: hypothetical protein IMX01_06895 [Limnochordaceae bacterium]|nr:hypothetical protein [Limnochordaceae bacterium]